jgi:hypothetical protein
MKGAVNIEYGNIKNGDIENSDIEKKWRSKF